ncbi:MAG: hypothetical protein AB201_03010 [Parcubacteria bacterium C7867-006]|nr:MAG: hypothetical protein AB201_03010 [Parcubacteria bacterium C7867-006]
MGQKERPALCGPVGMDSAKLNSSGGAVVRLHPDYGSRTRVRGKSAAPPRDYFSTIIK